MDSMKKLLKIILIALAAFLVLSIGIYILLEVFNTSGYSKEELRVICNSDKFYELGLTLMQCATVW
jgi:flagellar basal body-associated protein FliL